MSEIIILSGATDTDLKKKGRKPKQANYFDVREEMAVVRFLSTESSEEKNKIYNEFLRHPLDKMISSIIRRYKLYRKDMDFIEIHTDTHSFLMTKIENSPEFSYLMEGDVVDSEQIIKNFLKELDKFLNEETLNENEIKLGHALYDLFNDYENIFIGTSNNKFNKNIILLSLREMTNLSTKEIRSSMKKYRIIYLNLVEKMAQ
jgi:hypothetical protein